MSGEIPEWLKGTDCKSVGYAFVGSNPTLPTSLRSYGATSGVASKSGFEKTIRLIKCAKTVRRSASSA